MGDCIGNESDKAVSFLKSGEILILENLRFHPEEEQGDQGFAETITNWEISMLMMPLEPPIALMLPPQLSQNSSRTINALDTYLASEIENINKVLVIAKTR